jgi:hypothetical protein
MVARAGIFSYPGCSQWLPSQAMWAVGLGVCPALARFLSVLLPPPAFEATWLPIVAVGSCAYFVAGARVLLLLLLVGPGTPGAQAFIPGPSDR